MAKVTDIASNIFKFELDEPTDLSIPAIAQKLRASIGKLNNLLHTSFIVNESTYEIIDADNGAEISEDQVAIFTNLYMDYYYTKQSKAFLGANGIDTIKSINQDGIIVTLTDKNQIAKYYLDLKKQNKDDLRQLLNSYKQNRAMPRHVESDDRLPRRVPLVVDPTNNATIVGDGPYNSDRRY